MMAQEGVIITFTRSGTSTWLKWPAPMVQPLTTVGSHCAMQVALAVVLALAIGRNAPCAERSVGEAEITERKH